MKPIIFSTPMVKAILAGKKSVTRRVIKPQPVGEIRQDTAGDYGEDYGGGIALIKSPYKPSDVLYVRETWCEYVQEHIIDGQRFAYKATANEDCHNEYIKHGYPYKWRPSIHMPREAARIFLKVTDVSAERLQDISELEAKSEGIKSYWLHAEHGGEWHESNGSYVGIEDNTHPTRVRAFAELWNHIYAKKPEYKWDKNPWIWKISFERTEATK